LTIVTGSFYDCPFNPKKLVPNTAAILNSCLRSAGEWFLRSGIQEPSGGVARYYRSDLGGNARVSTEITGYTAGALVYLHHVTGDPECLDGAVRACRFLARVAWDGALRAMPFEYCADGRAPEALAYFFDTGIIVRALLALYRNSRDDEYLDAAALCGESMARDFAAGAEFHPIIQLPSKAPAPRDCRWSRGPGCYQLKAALAWCELAEETGREDFRDLYEQVLSSALCGHAAFPSGEGEGERTMDRLHAYSYFLEGLLPRADRPDCAEALRDGIARAAALLSKTAPLFERSDVYAQLLRVRIFADALGVMPLDRAAAAHEAAAIAEFQSGESDPRKAGGFYFGRKTGHYLPYLNPVSTAFCVQALDFWARHCAGSFHPAWQTLI
jgi:hypothetical protein